MTKAQKCNINLLLEKKYVFGTGFQRSGNFKTQLKSAVCEDLVNIIVEKTLMTIGNGVQKQTLA